ncbi:hypothetical protein [Bermanella sp. R86510]|uniref:hypothetical protein n=1 Tax=unclassified Bermanella TaxID=2627862 RepID=UPI0037CAA64A
MSHFLNKVNGFIEQLPFTPLLIISIYLLFAPFMSEPHLWQKSKWLINGNTFALIDVFDVVFHLFPVILFLWRALLRKRAKGNSQKRI